MIPESKYSLNDNKQSDVMDVLSNNFNLKFN